MIPASEAYIIPFDAVVKAREVDGRRSIEVQASSEDVDQEGDVVLQKALLDSGPDFIATGHLDIDHISEIGHRIGVKDPTSYIIGRPTEVVDLGKGRTGVVGEIMQSRDGSFDPSVNKFDSFWKSLQSDPPVRWSASIYGFPIDVDDCTTKSCGHGASRYVIKSMRWKSLALTRKPINDTLKGFAKIITAKSFAAVMKSAFDLNLSDDRLDSYEPFLPPPPPPYQSEVARSDGLEPSMTMPMVALAETAPPLLGMFDGPQLFERLWGNYELHIKQCCPFVNWQKTKINSVTLFKDHFMCCCGLSSTVAELFAYSLMYMIMRDRNRGT